MPSMAAITFIEQGKIKIRSRSGKLVSMIPTRIQQVILDAIGEDLATETPIRHIYLKPRQVKVSSIVAAYLYADARVHEGRQTLVAANEQSTCDDLWSAKYQTFKLHEEPEPPCKYDSRHTMAFEDTQSQIDVRVGRKGLGRGGTRQNLHITELPYMTDPEGVVAEVMPCVPSEEGTAIFLESTGARPGDFYETLFYEALKANEAGEKHEYRAFFFPWTMCEEYCLNLDYNAKTEVMANLSAEERELVNEYNLQPGHVAFRRAKIREYAGNINTFINRYPLTPEEAFSITRETIFDLNAMRWYEQNNICAPKRKCVVKMTDEYKPNLVDSDTGELSVFQPAMGRMTYTMYMDSAGDYGEESTKFHSLSAIVVIENETGEVVATWEGRRDPALFARVGYAIGMEYNKATNIVEVNNQGNLTFHELLRMRYPNMWVNPDYTGQVAMRRIGFFMDKNNKAAAVGKLQELLRERRLGLRCARVLSEMGTFRQMNASTQRAQKGKQDGLVIACAVASMIASKGQKWSVREAGSTLILEGKDKRPNSKRVWVPEPLPFERHNRSTGSLLGDLASRI